MDYGLNIRGGRARVRGCGCVMEPPVLRVQRLGEKTSKLPIRATPGSAGLDLCAAEKCTLPPKTRQVVRTQLAVELPVGTYGQIAPRSGLAVKNGIDVLAGVIDSDYKGEVGVVLINHGADAYPVNFGARIAQLLVLPILIPTVVEVGALGSLTASERGGGGFGSTGV